MTASAFVRRVARAPLPSVIRRPLRWAYRRRPALPSLRRRRLAPPADELRAARAAGDRRRADRLVAAYRRLRLDVEEAASPDRRRKPGVPLELASGVQSKQFMIDLLPHLQRHLHDTYPRGTVLDVLDVGPGTGHGTALLASLYASDELGYRMHVTAVDIADHHRDYVGVISPYVTHEIADIFELDRSFDVVICSHVIEHVVRPVRFCRRLQQLARDAVFVVAPYNEPRDQLSSGHRNVIDEQLLGQLQPTDTTIVNSPGWGAFRDPPYEMVIAKLAGNAAARR